MMVTMLPDPGGRDPAPEPLVVVQRFVNTVDTENVIEELSAPADLHRVLVRLGLLSEAARVPSRDDLRRALDVREALRSLLLANNGEPLDPDAYGALEAASRRARLSLSWSEEGSRLVPQTDGVDAALGRVLTVVHDSMTDGTWQRLKACRREICHWAFYDRSKNRSSTWCAMSVCGNRTKKRRAYRRRSPR